MTQRLPAPEVTAVPEVSIGQALGPSEQEDHASQPPAPLAALAFPSLGLQIPGRMRREG